MNNITLAICAYNCEQSIEETLTSVVNQSYQEFDLLIVNDCSTDNSEQILKSFFKINNRQYKLINLTENEGVANARQIALEQAKTKYLLFVDSDDLPDEKLVEKEYKVICSDAKIMAVSSWLSYIDMNGNSIRGGFYLGSKTKEEFMSIAKKEKLIFLPIQTLFNREIALKVGGFRLDGFPDSKPRYQDFCEDLDLWTRMSDLYENGYYIITIPESLYLYRKGNSGLSSNAVQMLLKMKFVKKNLKLRRAKLNEMIFLDFLKTVSEDELQEIEKNAKAGYYLRNGFFLLKENKISKGIYYVSKSILMNPKQFFQKIKANSGYFN